MLRQPTPQKNIHPEKYYGMFQDVIYVDEITPMPTPTDTLAQVVSDQLRRNPWTAYRNLPYKIRQAYTEQQWIYVVDQWGKSNRPEDLSPDALHHYIGLLVEKFDRFDQKAPQQGPIQIAPDWLQPIIPVAPPVTPPWQQLQQLNYQRQLKGMDPLNRLPDHYDPLLKPQEEVRLEPKPWPPYDQLSPKELPPVKENHKGVKTMAVPPAPTHLCVQLIGGPFNAEQRILPRDGKLQQGSYYKIEDQQPAIIDEKGNLIAGILLIYRYKLTFIPPSETPFSDEQIVIGLFQYEQD